MPENNEPENASNNESSGELGLPDKPRRTKPILLGGIAAVLVAVLAVVLIVVNTGSDEGSSDRAVVKIGVADASKEYWQTFIGIAADEGIDVELVNFSDYQQPNPALSQGQTDLNLFQHLLFLADYNVSNNDDLTPIGSTYVVPLSVYSDKHTDLAQIPDGGTVAIPNDATNQARALLVLQSAGLISLKGGGNVLSTPAEIDEAASKVSVTPVDASQTVPALPSVDASVVNNNFALDGGLDPTTALYGDDPNSPVAEPYINIVAARAEDKDNPTYQRIVELYQDKRVSDLVQADSKGTSVFVSRTSEDLEGVLSRLTDTVRTAKQ
ncbi:MetQ/NlpA family ABC transporter substrate-binding protein [Prauserella cavernicola]|uniref:Methionine ABC transporter substrate-binding protein n=1 Tax=Prauserella cavernicola TaxID=2800127 RepID=A0A934QUG9_9PSEU|nr:MetQ/NlpA family ABC transporter substrate-binding protein [Prauserella cavernicola]MBK1786675.1 methionine ABC transporter substrate-binding protein [Prauserella cavernicola]